MSPFGHWKHLLLVICISYISQMSGGGNSWPAEYPDLDVDLDVDMLRICAAISSAQFAAAEPFQNRSASVPISIQFAVMIPLKQNIHFFSCFPVSRLLRISPADIAEIGDSDVVMLVDLEAAAQGSPYDTIMFLLIIGRGSKCWWPIVVSS